MQRAVIQTRQARCFRPTVW